MYFLLQQLVHNHAEKGKKRPKKFRGDPWPSVRSALDALEEEDRARLAEANAAFVAMFEFQPQDEWELEIAAHEASFDPDPDELSPVQLERIRAAGLPLRDRASPEPPVESSSSVTRGGLGVPQAPTFSDLP